MEKSHKKITQGLRAKQLNILRKSVHFLKRIYFVVTKKYKFQNPESLKLLQEKFKIEIPSYLRFSDSNYRPCNPKQFYNFYRLVTLQSTFDAIFSALPLRTEI